MFGFKNKKFLEDKKAINSFMAIAVVNFFVLGLIFVFLGFSPIKNVNLNPANISGYELIKEGVKTDPFITKNPYAREKISEPIIHGDDPSLGARDAKVNMIFFSDFNCKFCKEQFQVLREALGNYDKDVRLVWKDYPDADTSSQSWQSSIAGRCAYEQDKFWQYYDLLTNDKEILKGEDYVRIAKDTGLDLNKFRTCLKDQEAKMKVEDNIYEADSLEIIGVPYLFINNREMLGDIDKKEIMQIINFELQKDKEK